jgi:hypothetical protein
MRFLAGNSVARLTEKVSIDQVIDRLQQLRKTRSGWSARCPAHEDRSPSLSVALGDDGRILLYCWGGCSFQEITRALGFEPGDLSPGRPRPRTPEERRQAQEEEKQRELDRALEAWSARAWIRLAALRRSYFLVLDGPENMTAERCDMLLYCDHILDQLEGSLSDKLGVMRMARAGKLCLPGVIIS